MPQDTPVINPNATAVTSPAVGIKPEDLLNEIQTRLLNTSGAISSGANKIEDTITSAIAKTQEAGAAAKKATESAFGREIADVTEKAAMAETGFLEAQRGYATNTAALKSLRDNNEKSIRDLTQRKEEVMLQGDIATASKISDLILKKYEFEQNATQQVFQNLVSLSNFGLQRAQEARLAQTQKFSEEQAISNIALRYGVEVKEGDTFADVVERAKPFASEEQRLQLEKMKSELALTKANTSRALAEAAAAGKKINESPTFSTDDMRVFITGLKNGQKTIDEVKSEILKLQITPEQRKQAYVLAEQMFTQTETPTTSGTSTTQPFTSPLANTAFSTGKALGSAGQTVLDFIFGTSNQAQFPSLFRK